MVFPRRKFKEHILKDDFPSNPSGQMNAELFPLVIDHCIKHTGRSKERPSLLIFDNHEGLISI